MQNAAKKHRYRQLAVAVYVHVQQIVVAVVFQFDPCAARGHCRRVVDGLAVFVAKDVAVNTRRTDKLRHDDALGTVDDETTRVGHQGEVTHKHFLIDKFARSFVGKADGQAQRTCVSGVAKMALCFGVLGRGFDFVIEKVQTEVTGKVLDRRKVLKYFGNALFEEVTVTFLLHLDEVGQRQYFLAFRERFSVVISVSTGFDVLYH